jgi:hypothetical protein
MTRAAPKDHFAWADEMLRHASMLKRTVFHYPVAAQTCDSYHRSQGNMMC